MYLPGITVTLSAPADGRSDYIATEGHALGINCTVTQKTKSKSVKTLVGVHLLCDFSRSFNIDAPRVRLPHTVTDKTSVTFRVTCTPKSVGINTCVLVLQFNGFCIGRFITVSCTDLLVSEMLKPTEPYKGRKQRQRLQFRGDMLKPTQDGGGTRPVPDQVALGKHGVPAEWRDKVLGKEAKGELERVHEMSQRDEKAHLTLLSLSMFTEELQMERDIKLYDQEGIILQPCGHCLKAIVPGVAESRPSVLRHDTVLVTVQGRKEVYMGHVERVEQEELQLVFHRFVCIHLHVKFVYIHTIPICTHVHMYEPCGASGAGGAAVGGSKVRIHSYACKICIHTYYTYMHICILFRHNKEVYAGVCTVMVTVTVTAKVMVMVMVTVTAKVMVTVTDNIFRCPKSMTAPPPNCPRTVHVSLHVCIHTHMHTYSY